MKRKTLSLLLALVMIFALAVPAMAEGPAVTATNQTITVDGKAVTAEVYNIDGSNYFKLRDVAQMLNGTAAQFSVGYDESTRTVKATSGEAYTAIGGELTAGEDKSATCVESTQTISINGLARETTAYNIGGSNFFKLRDLGNILGFGVSYDADARAVVVDSDDALSFADATSTTLTAKVDGKDVKVAWYVDTYVAHPYQENNQKINVYVPENATKDSPIMLYVQNGGWMMNTYPTNTIEDGKDYDGTNNKVGVALKEGYVVISYGCRGRADAETELGYLGHSPATMTDTKAVIRYLRYNAAALPAGNPERIVVTGTSGGGALSSVIAASGNSSDYFESLYEIGAAGVAKNADGTYTSTVSDAVYATIAYCPITDLPHADAAYEWVYGPVREAYAAAGLKLEDINPNPGGMGAPKDTDSVFGESVLAASKELAASYVTYINGLNLKDGSKALKADDGSFMAAIKGLLEASVEKELTSAYPSTDKAPANGDYDWLTITDGKASIDMDKYLYWIGTKMSGLKTAPAFSNKNTPNQHPMLNEDNIFGTAEQAYSPFEFWSWNNHTGEGTVGKNNTGLDWDAYMKTDAGKALALQMKMTSPFEYLMSTTDGDSAPHWYVRHGMGDRDTAFAVSASMYYLLKADTSIEDVDFSYAWLKPHSGDYDVAEAYAWLKTIL